MSPKDRKPFKTIFRRMMFNVNVVLSGCAVGFFAWNATSYIKSRLLDHYTLSLNAWASYYYHPHDASLFNYVVLCVAMALYGLVFYVKTQRNSVRYVRKKSRTLGNRYPLLLLLSSALFFVLLNRHWEMSQRLLMSLYLLFILFVPLKFIPLKRYRFRHLCDVKVSMCWRDILARHKGNVLLLLTFLLLCVVSVEPLKVIKGPIYVMNEFKNIYSDTKINGTYVNNRTFLDSIEKGTTGKAEISEFFAANDKEYFHQNASWGPFNHIGHILNPLNEYISGKAPADVYMQYGQGNTLLYKWTMELFGGMSLDNFYKCYIFYIIYSMLYILLLLYLFRDKLYVFNAFAVYSIAFFSAGYWVFIHAPGVIPTIHLFDTTVFLFLLLYFRRNNLVFLVSAIVLAALSIYMNRQFGLVLLISLGAACLPYLWETKQGKERYTLLAMLVLLPLVMLAAPFFKTTANASSTLFYFLRGYLSWRPDPDVVFLTIVYLVVSYHFLFLIRRQTHYLKYAFIFVFIYSQGLLTYFFWSGLSNHLMPVIPFIGLELLLMLYISKELIVKTGGARIALTTGMVLGTAWLAFTCNNAIGEFYKSKRIYTRNFTQHRIYQWDFDRAKIATTINPEPFRESIALIQKYRPQENSGIHLLSVYDNVLPFLAKRYSMMPFFEMQWFVFTSKERAEAINRLKSQKPEYLFVENGISEEHPDPWAPYFNAPEINAFRKANQERRLELGKIFTAVEDGYEKVEEGVLLSVYKRKSLYAASARH
ncbi:hypothetical protein [Geobacter sp. AOG1]|uniref:hypothetical protein n=1 Tax=Geobacter sp. AOG1 TaxID=1566346 RepID=UPI001CC532EC|nr:hypothetical protein [Geobacter sp. AOG1]GFE58126.1 hypothetical protein AOG1_20060 [Geobacter sp. AOG1]